MIDIRPFGSLGGADHGWLKARHHFSFAGYNDPTRMNWGRLRVWNDDEIAAGTGFDAHPHRDMEIITYVRKGAISHRDSLGNDGRTAAGDVQVMHAGTGIMHSEWNKEDEHTLLYQIWVEPDRRGHAPGWAEAKFPKADRAGRWVPLASGEEHVQDALAIHRDATLYGAFVKAGTSVTHTLRPGRRAYLVLADGKASVNGTSLSARDGAAITDTAEVTLAATTDSEVLLFDLP